MSLAGGLGLWAVATIPLSMWPGGSLQFLLEMYFKTLALFWLLANIVNTVRRLRCVAWVLTIASVLVAHAAVSNYESNTFLTAPSAIKRIAGYEAPLTSNPNDLALMLNLILPLSVALVLSTRSKSARAVLLAIIALDAVAVVVTFSRGGFVTLVATVLLFLWRLRDRPERKWAFMVVALALAALPLLPSGYTDRLSTITNIDSDTTGSAQARSRDMLAALSFVVQHPITGAGVGLNVEALNKERGATWVAVHNSYLEYAVELGLPGLALFVMLLVTALRGAVAVARRAEPRAASAELFHLAQGIHGGLVAFSVAAFFHPAGYHIYFYYVAGLAVAARTICDRTIA
jgi:putative inorganic carbon (HCO3(-)) transporter